MRASLSRRTIQAETEVRRRVAEAIHDGPVQELIGLDMILAAAAQRGRPRQHRDAARAASSEARELADAQHRALRDEIVDLGPYAFEELGYRGGDRELPADLEAPLRLRGARDDRALELAPETAGDLFRIAQEAVVNAGRHAGAEAVSIIAAHASAASSSCA